LNRICVFVGYVAKNIINFGNMTIEESNKQKSLIVVIDKSLEIYKGKNIFPEKLAKANEVLKRIGLPKAALN
jgi:hypothetical protein